MALSGDQCQRRHWMTICPYRVNGRDRITSRVTRPGVFRTSNNQTLPHAQHLQWVYGIQDEPHVTVGRRAPGRLSALSRHSATGPDQLAINRASATDHDERNVAPIHHWRRPQRCASATPLCRRASKSRKGLAITGWGREKGRRVTKVRPLSRRCCDHRTDTDTDPSHYWS